MPQRTETYDFIVCGGGLAGVCAAIAAARQGLRTALVQDRPVLGGNASSEVRVTVHGAAAHHNYARETGILSEALIEERARNHEVINENGWTNCVLDMVLYDLVQREELLTLHLNTSVYDVVLTGGVSGLARTEQRPPAEDSRGYALRPACAEGQQITAVRCRVANAELDLELRADTFADCTGDALIADLAGCEWRMGSEGVEETGELHAPPTASRDTMGNSIHIRARDIGRDAPYTAPNWAVKHDDPAYFYEQGRKPHDPRGGFWWIEIGIPWDTIHDNETIRHELTRHALGIWDWMKNRDETMRSRCRTYALDWIGQVPGKRESRRVRGLYWLTENDLQERVAFDDEVAFGGWFVDLHTPGGLLADTSEPASAEGYKDDSEYAAKSFVGPYGVPLRSLIARDVSNLYLAGRNVSTTRAALGTVRVMGTTALMGQAVGTAAAIAKHAGQDAHGSAALAPVIKQQLLEDGCFLVNTASENLLAGATISASSQAVLYGTSPSDSWVSGGQGRHAPAARGFGLEREGCQWLYVAGGKLDAVSLCLDCAAPATLQLRLRKVASIWDYRRDGPVVAEATHKLKAGNDQWLRWDTALAGLDDGCYRIEAFGAGIVWRHSPGMTPGCVSGFAMSAERMRPRGGFAMSFRLEPAQAVWSPQQVASGVTRPGAQSNLWRSDPAQPLPQHLACTWDQPQAISTVQVTFAGHLMREIHAAPPFFRDAQTAKNYRIQVQEGATWRDLVVVQDNYQQCRRHELPQPVTATALRLVVDATNGDPSAAVYELRVS
ncbi:MAG: FAD-dependent oxidoreductase [Planctomycetota bacterium]|jgi:hypothetical protein|nr:FAD-dependent oxidoreductase [Planctomycetota bacterium]